MGVPRRERDQPAGSSVVLELREDARPADARAGQAERPRRLSCYRRFRHIVEQLAQACTPRVAAGTRAQVLLLGD